jgi:hypothetical protein
MPNTITGSNRKDLLAALDALNAVNLPDPSEAGDVAEALQETLDNMGEKAREGERASAMEEAVSQLETARDAIEQAQSFLDEAVAALQAAVDQEH